MSLIDGLLAFVILLVAGWLLVRTLAKNKSGCTGCSGCSARSRSSEQDLKQIQ